MALILQIVSLLIGVGGCIVSAALIESRLWRTLALSSFGGLGVLALILIVLSYEQTSGTQHLYEVAYSRAFQIVVALCAGLAGGWWLKALIRKQESDIGPTDTSPAFQSPGSPGNFRLSYARPEVAEPIALLVSQADGLLVETITNGAELESWKQRLQEWNDAVLRVLRTKVSESRALSYSEYVRIPPIAQEQFANAFSREHNTLLNDLQRRRTELRHIHSSYVD